MTSGDLGLASTGWTEGASLVTHRSSLFARPPYFPGFEIFSIVRSDFLSLPAWSTTSA